MWDTKRQIIWLATAIILGTFFLYPQARDEMNVIDWPYFALLELILFIVIGVMFYIYSRKR
jgi:nitric oxide reductase large subunit